MIFTHLEFIFFRNKLIAPSFKLSFCFGKEYNKKGMITKYFHPNLYKEVLLSLVKI